MFASPTGRSPSRCANSRSRRECSAPVSSSRTGGVLSIRASTRNVPSTLRDCASAYLIKVPLKIMRAMTNSITLETCDTQILVGICVVESSELTRKWRDSYQIHQQPRADDQHG